MFVSHSRKKLINAIIYFVRHTKHCHTLKLFKLLNFLDFEHYRQTGRAVTGLTYKAWQHGPAPSELWHEMSSPKPDLAQAVVITPIRDELSGEQLRRDIKPRKQFDRSVFTKREFQIMERLAEYFYEFKAGDMREMSHMHGLPWRKVYKKGEGEGHLIPIELSLSSDPIIQDMPSIDQQELAYREEAMAEVRNNVDE